MVCCFSSLWPMGYLYQPGLILFASSDHSRLKSTYEGSMTQRPFLDHSSLYAFDTVHDDESMGVDDLNFGIQF
jgi:hypothetical protein